MNTKTDKLAFFTIDVERFADTECVHKSGQKVSQTMLDGLDRYIDILDRHGIKATLFVLTEFVDDIAPKLKKYIESGHKIALHGEKHFPPHLITNKQFEYQISRARQKLEKILNTKVLGYRAPCFGIDNEKLEIIQRLGFLYDSSVIGFSGARHSSGLDVSSFKSLGGGIYKKDGFYEFAMSTKKIFGKSFPVSGGGYVRVSNHIFAKYMLNSYFKKNNRYVFYSHPFEFSAQKPPKIKGLKLYDRFYLRFGLFSYCRKLEYIIKRLKKYGYEFTTFESFIEARPENMPEAEI